MLRGGEGATVYGGKEARARSKENGGNEGVTRLGGRAASHCWSDAEMRRRGSGRMWRGGESTTEGEGEFREEADQGRSGDPLSAGWGLDAERRR